jgi:hypothetical protein
MAKKHKMTKHDRLQARRIKEGYQGDIDWSSLIPETDSRQHDADEDYAQWAKETAKYWSTIQHQPKEFPSMTNANMAAS